MFVVLLVPSSRTALEQLREHSRTSHGHGTKTVRFHENSPADARLRLRVDGEIVTKEEKDKLVETSD